MSSSGGNKRKVPSSIPPERTAGSGSSGNGGGTPTADPNLYVPILVALILVFVTILYLWTRKSRKGRSVLIVGPCEAGKTALFSRIVGGPVVQTVTSLVPNELEFAPVDGKAALVVKDLPGHDRVQIKFWESNKAGARGIICVVDGAGGNKGIREAADVLYRVLTDPSVLAANPALYIFANKQDLPMAKGIKVIRTQLEKELTTLRMTKSASLLNTGGKESAGGKVLGRADKDFDFEHLTQLKIEFGEGSANGNEKDMTDLISWLNKIA